MKPLAPIERKTILLLLFCSWYNLALTQSLGKVIEAQIIKSKILSKDVHDAVYRPADYGVSDRSYPVVYLLHGLNGDHAGWLQWGEINRYVDRASLTVLFHR